MKKDRTIAAKTSKASIEEKHISYLGQIVLLLFLFALFLFCFFSTSLI